MIGLRFMPIFVDNALAGLGRLDQLWSVFDVFQVKTGMVKLVNGVIVCQRPSDSSRSGQFGMAFDSSVETVE